MMFTRILVPFDGTPESNAALPLARTLARETGAAITLLRVRPYPYLLTERAAFDEAAEALKRVADELASAGIQVEFVVRGVRSSTRSSSKAVSSRQT
jgi:nucleotide-binding universal stress UspA family protein